MFRLFSFWPRSATTIRCSCLLILVFPLGGDDCLDSPHRELHSGRKLTSTVVPFDFGDRFQRVSWPVRVRLVRSGGRSASSSSRATTSSLVSRRPILAPEASMIAFCFSLIAWRTAGIAISLGAERSGFL